MCIHASRDSACAIHGRSGAKLEKTSLSTGVRDRSLDGVYASHSLDVAPCTSSDASGKEWIKSLDVAAE